MTEVDLRALVDAAVGVMPLGMCIAEAPAGAIVFANDQLWQLFGLEPHAIRSVDEYDRFPLYTESGDRIETR